MSLAFTTSDGYFSLQKYIVGNVLNTWTYLKLAEKKEKILYREMKARKNKQSLTLWNAHTGSA